VLQPVVWFASVRDALHRQVAYHGYTDESVGLGGSPRASGDQTTVTPLRILVIGNLRGPTWLLVNNQWLTSQASLQTCSRQVLDAHRKP
jgi:hypothetical protein